MLVDRRRQVVSYIFRWRREQSPAGFRNAAPLLTAPTREYASTKPEASPARVVHASFRFSSIAYLRCHAAIRASVTPRHHAFFDVTPAASTGSIVRRDGDNATVRTTPQPPFHIVPKRHYSHELYSQTAMLASDECDAYFNRRYHIRNERTSGCYSNMNHRLSKSEERLYAIPHHRDGRGTASSHRRKIQAASVAKGAHVEAK
jgi:hypothetical protein